MAIERKNYYMVGDKEFKTRKAAEDFEAAEGRKKTIVDLFEAKGKLDGIEGPLTERDRTILAVAAMAIVENIDDFKLAIGIKPKQKAPADAPKK